MSFSDYVIETKRLGLRAWRLNDWKLLHAINQDPEVMRFFPTLPSLDETQSFVFRMMKLYEEKGYCYFATEIKSTKEFIGFVGLQDVDLKLDFTPATDIGWRLKKTAWQKGYATEAAAETLRFGFNEVKLKEIISLAPSINKPSLKVMEKIGMLKKKNFAHPKLLNHPTLKQCSLYCISKY